MNTTTRYRIAEAADNLEEAARHLRELVDAQPQPQPTPEEPLIARPAWFDTDCPHSVGKGRGARFYRWSDMIEGSFAGGREAVIRWMADADNNKVTMYNYQKATFCLAVIEARRLAVG